ncbi:hypothetical protein [uncultured Sphingomonas sp.]|uniref:hypothetical protein n=1 Tax=uncultured Sphingomonas sp. TaxID=158754 RepID=UPI00258C5B8F|nr:hypothetical protein [uncultured Sphingomonas sp.]
MIRAPAPLLAALLLAGCDGEGTGTGTDAPAGRALEAEARARAMVADPAKLSLVGVFGSDSDRLCALPVDGARRFRVGASVDYGEGQRCVARGTATGSGRLAIDFGEGCAFDAVQDGTGIRFPAVLPTACDSRCEGRASLAALLVASVSDAPAEALRTRGSDGKLLCAD